MEYYNTVTRSVFNFKYFEGPIVYVSTINHFMAAFDFDFSFLSILN